MIRAWVLASLLLAMGCAHAGPLRLAQAPVVVCKHCNCYMPAPTPATADAPCTVCNCRYPASHCERGT